MEPSRSYVICCVQRTGSWLLAHTLREEPAADVERILALVRFAQQCEDGWRQWFASAGIQLCEVVYEDLVRDRLTVANRVLEFLHLPLLDAGSLPPIRYRQQADNLTDSYLDLVRTALEEEVQPPLS
jgi:LPS sulfotransferase NodH